MIVQEKSSSSEALEEADEHNAATWGKLNVSLYM